MVIVMHDDDSAGFSLIVRMLNGGHESGFQEGKKKFKKVLLQVKGRKNAYASEVKNFVMY